MSSALSNLIRCFRRQREPNVLTNDRLSTSVELRLRVLSDADERSSRSSSVSDAMTLALEPTPDLVQQAAANKQPHQHVVAFALEEPAVLIQRATAKMKRKGVDAMVANPLQTMDASDITATWMSASGDVIKLPEMGKMDFARRLIELSFCL